MPDAALQPLYRAARVETLAVAFIDGLTFVYHRASGLTHILAPPAPEIIAALGEAGLTLDGLMARLTADYALADADRDALAARLGELVAAGLVSRE